MRRDHGRRVRCSRAGFDLSEFTRAADDADFGRELWASSDRYHDTVLRFPLPTIASINGPALAGGFDLAMLCDLRIASTTARFAHPERTFGDVVYGPLHDLVGGAVARELTIGGREIDAQEALAMHLVGEVVEPDALARRDRGVRRARVRRTPRGPDAHEGEGPPPRRLRRGNPDAGAVDRSEMRRPEQPEGCAGSSPESGALAIASAASRTVRTATRNQARLDDRG